MSTAAQAERRQQDLRKVRELCDASGGRLSVHAVRGDPLSEIVLDLRYRTAGGTDYPTRALDRTRVTISLPGRYPWSMPTAVISPPLLHPNVYSSGAFCLGSRWIPTEGLDLLVRRIVQIVTFDPLVLNTSSPANGAALAWYRTAVRTHPRAFPTDAVSFQSQAAEPPRVTWHDVPAQAPPAPQVVRCPGCAQQLRVPSGRARTVRCPRCRHTFRVGP